MASPYPGTPAANAARRRVFETVLREQSLQKHGQARRPPRTPNRQPRNDFNFPPTQQASPIEESRASKKQSSERPGIGKGAARGGPGKPLPVGQRHSHLPAIPRVWEIAPAGRPGRLRAGRAANVRGYRGRKQPGLARRSGIAGLPVKKFRPCGPPTLAFFAEGSGSGPLRTIHPHASCIAAGCRQFKGQHSNSAC